MTARCILAGRVGLLPKRGAGSGVAQARVSPLRRTWYLLSACQGHPTHIPETLPRNLGVDLCPRQLLTGYPFSWGEQKSSAPCFGRQFAECLFIQAPKVPDMLCSSGMLSSEKPQTSSVLVLNAISRCPWASRPATSPALSFTCALKPTYRAPDTGVWLTWVSVVFLCSNILIHWPQWAFLEFGFSKPNTRKILINHCTSTP